MRICIPGKAKKNVCCCLFGETLGRLGMVFLTRPQHLVVFLQLNGSKQGLTALDACFLKSFVLFWYGVFSTGLYMCQLCR